MTFFIRSTTYHWQLRQRAKKRELFHFVVDPIHWLRHDNTLQTTCSFVNRLPSVKGVLMFALLLAWIMLVKYPHMATICNCVNRANIYDGHHHPLHWFMTQDIYFICVLFRKITEFASCSFKSACLYCKRDDSAYCVVFRNKAICRHNPWIWILMNICPQGVCFDVKYHRSLI